jgi:TM2 domain-containing membrane protein YozV
MPAADAPKPGVSQDAKAMMRYDASKKSLLIAYLIWFFLGGLGVHRFYLGDSRSGGIILGCAVGAIALGLAIHPFFGILWAVVGVWLLVDLFLMPGLVRKANNELIDRLGAKA